MEQIATKTQTSTTSMESVLKVLEFSFLTQVFVAHPVGGHHVLLCAAVVLKKRIS